MYRSFEHMNVSEPLYITHLRPRKTDSNMRGTESCTKTCLVGLGASMNVSSSGIFGSDCSQHFTSILNIVPVFALAEVCSSWIHSVQFLQGVQNRSCMYLVYQEPTKLHCILVREMLS